VFLWYNKGKYHQDNGQLSEALDCYKAILRREPFNTSANYNIGYIHLLEGRYLDGANYFSDVTYSNSNFAAAFFARGLCFKGLGEYKKAEFDFNKTLIIDPGFTQAQKELSNLRN
jgi:tetratricopeptide (TPR) repeat protein